MPYVFSPVPATGKADAIAAASVQAPTRSPDSAAVREKRAMSASAPAQPAATTGNSTRYPMAANFRQPPSRFRTTNQPANPRDTTSAVIPDRDIVRTSDNAMTTAAAA